MSSSSDVRVIRTQSSLRKTSSSKKKRRLRVVPASFGHARVRASSREPGGVGSRDAAARGFGVVAREGSLCATRVIWSRARNAGSAGRPERRGEVSRRPRARRKKAPTRKTKRLRRRRVGSRRFPSALSASRSPATKSLAHAPVRLLRGRDGGEDLLHLLGGVDVPVPVELGVHDGAVDVHFKRAGRSGRGRPRRLRLGELGLDGVLHRPPLGGVAWRRAEGKTRRGSVLTWARARDRDDAHAGSLRSRADGRDVSMRRRSRKRLFRSARRTGARTHLSHRST